MVKSIGANFLELPLAKVVDVKSPIVYGIVQPGPNLSDGMVFVQSRDVGGKIDLTSLQKTSTKIASRYGRSNLRSGDILFSLRGNIGQCSIAPAGLDGANIARGIARIRVRTGFDNQYVRYALQAPAVCRKIARNANGSTFRELSIDELRQLCLPFPPFSEQRKIAEILQTWDEAIEKLEVLRAAKERLARRLTHILLTGQKRYPGYTGEWKICRLMDVASVSKGKALTKKDITPGVYPVIAGGKASPYSHSSYTHEDIVSVSASGAYAGYVSLHREKVWASDCSVIQAQNGYDLMFLYHMLRMNQNRIYSLQIGSAQPHVYSKDLAMMRVQIPTLPEQKKITLVLSTIDCEIDALKNEIDQLKLQKRGLMQKLLTGEWRVHSNNSNNP